MSKLEPIVVTGDLILLTEEERIRFYVQVCDAMGLDFRTRPLQYFEQLDHNNKRNLILYALRNAAAQLRKKYNLSVTLSSPEFSNDVVMFTATVAAAGNTVDSAVGAVSLKGLEGKEYADAIMAAQTKAKRRAILDAVGSGMLDESEVEGMKGSVVEVTKEQLEGYVPIPPAPEPSSAPATEVVESPIAVVSPQVDSVVPLQVNSVAVGLSTATEAPDKTAEAEITSRLNAYRRDTLAQGGMRPSKGFGIAAKWSKFVTKHAPNKTIEEYQTLLTALDLVLQQKGPQGVVAKIEQEIA